MEIDPCQCARVMKAFRPNLRVAAAQHGYSLVELLVAITLGSVVLASLGGVLLVSEVKVSANIQRNLDTKDAVNRTIDLIRREATLSSRTDFGDADPQNNLSSCADNTPLIYYQPASDASMEENKICYKTAVVDKGAVNGLPSSYGLGLKGPCVLLRIGPPFKHNGDLLYSAPNEISKIQVLLDGLAGAPGCPPEGFTADLESSLSTIKLTSPRRKANIQIKLASGATYMFDVQIPSNLPYDGVNLYRKCRTAEPTESFSCGSDSATRHYLTEKFSNRPEETGDPITENIFYFQNPYSDYALSKSRDLSLGACEYSDCFVSRVGYEVTLHNVDALIFPDKEIRPTR